jgi:hypothetical protein
VGAAKENGCAATAAMFASAALALHPAVFGGASPGVRARRRRPWPTQSTNLSN